MQYITKDPIPTVVAGSSALGDVRGFSNFATQFVLAQCFSIRDKAEVSPPGNTTGASGILSFSGSMPISYVK